MQEHTTPEKLEKYSFLWSEVRLIIAAIALFMGGMPPVFFITPNAVIGPMSTMLTLCYVVSGLTALYLLYKWNVGGRVLFGARDMLDRVLFLISTLSGVHLGLSGLIGQNIGMMVTMNYMVFVVAGILYLVSAGWLYKRWSESSKKLFHLV